MIMTLFFNYRTDALTCLQVKRTLKICIKNTSPLQKLIKRGHGDGYDTSTATTQTKVSANFLTVHTSQEKTYPDMNIIKPSLEIVSLCYISVLYHVYKIPMPIKGMREVIKKPHVFIVLSYFYSHITSYLSFIRMFAVGLRPNHQDSLSGLV